MKSSPHYEVLEFVPADYFQRSTLHHIFPGHSHLPTELDLGSGDGAFLLAMAAHFPARNFLGVERLLGRVRKTARRALRANLTNVRLLRLDTAYAVPWLLPHAAFSRIHLLFPDPWPKKRHHRRRLFQPPFLHAIHDLLLPGGEFLFKTDHPDYFAHAHKVAAASPQFQFLPWDPDGAFYPETDFERHWLAAERPIHPLRLLKPP